MNGDGISDLLVGTLVAGRAYLFLGKSGFSGGSPDVIFTGSATGFGFTAMQIGDIDNDGFQDLAVADSTAGRKVYIYKGRANWVPAATTPPVTITDAQADYTLA